MNYKEVFTLAQDKGCYRNQNNILLDEELNELSKTWLGGTLDLIKSLRLTIIQTWLREERGIHVVYDRALNARDYTGTFKHEVTREEPIGSGIFHERASHNNNVFVTFNESLLDAIAEALNLL